MEIPDVEYEVSLINLEALINIPSETNTSNEKWNNLIDWAEYHREFFSLVYFGVNYFDKVLVEIIKLNPPEKLKNDVYHNYGLNGNDRSKCSEGYEVDHLISLELGGSNDGTNLWPQSYCGTNNAHDKDKLENELHRRVCKGQMQLIDAQMCIKTDWVMCYLKTFNK